MLNQDKRHLTHLQGTLVTCPDSCPILIKLLELPLRLRIILMPCSVGYLHQQQLKTPEDCVS